jgi:pantoate--beta-alanine ligase
MERLEDPRRAARWAAERRAAGGSLGFVPTMGALHEGHLELVRRAVRENDAACVSVFVNPLQFDDPADFARYPRDFDGDAELLRSTGCALVFTGTPQQFFPESPDPAQVPREDPGPDAAGLEGAHRPGHFEGVATIVRRLFECVRPTRAYFGEKDFQQTLVVAAVAARLGAPAVVVCPTSREPDGLARSSRNRLLTAADRERAPVLHAALRDAAAAWRGGERRAGALREVLHRRLRDQPLQLEYAEIRDPARFAAVPDADSVLDRARALIAARFGRVRLIDTLGLDPSAS